MGNWHVECESRLPLEALPEVTAQKGVCCEAQQPWHLEKCLKVLDMANRRDPWGYCAKVAPTSYQEC